MAKVVLECLYQGPNCEGVREVEARRASRVKYCLTCAAEVARESSRNHKKRNSVAVARVRPKDPNVYVAERLATLRLQVNAAVPLLELALQRGTWDLVRAAIKELTDEHAPVVDLRAYAPVSV